MAGLAPTTEAFENLSPAHAKSIAASIWKTSKADQLDDPGVALVVGDWFWGSNALAWQRIKEALHSAGHPMPSSDGFDAATIEVLNGVPAHELIALLSEARRRHHAEIVASDPSQAVFLNGWQRRTDQRELMAMTMSGGWMPQTAEALGGISFAPGLKLAGRVDASMIHTGLRGSDSTAGTSSSVMPGALRHGDPTRQNDDSAVDPGVFSGTKRRRSPVANSRESDEVVQAFAPTHLRC